MTTTIRKPASVATAAGALLSVRDLRKARSQADARFELHVPDFAVAPGQFVAIVGDSGCGKSTLLDTLALVLRPTSCAGFVLGAGHGFPAADLQDLWALGDQDRLAAIRRTQLGYVLQTGGLLPFLSVEENIRLPTRLAGATAGRDEIQALAQRIGIQGMLSKKPQHLSGGQRQRAAILRALIHKPRIILADEPTAAVDKARAGAIVADFAALARDRGTTIVMVTHDHDLVRPFADATYSFTLSHPSPTEVRSVCHRLS